MRSKIFTSALIILLTLAACSSPGTAPVQVPSSPVPTSTTLPAPTITTTEAAATSTIIPSTPTSPPHASRVLILSIDGLRSDAIALAPMPNLAVLIQNSAYSLSAQTVLPSVTLVAHASMLGGVCPSKHGVDWNDYQPERGYAIGTDLFDLAHASGFQTVMYVGKKKLRQVTEPASTDTFVFINERDLVITERLLADFPQDFGVLFIHFPTPDWMGHEYGWLSPEQLSVIQRADEALGLILAELDTRGLRDETLIIITADHGGHDTGHGTNLPVDMTIPWVASGPGIQPKPLSTQIHTMDTAATAAFALGLSIPAEWDGVPVYEAFGLPSEKGSVACP